jgi:hypothetical protein
MLIETPKRAFDDFAGGGGTDQSALRRILGIK